MKKTIFLFLAFSAVFSFAQNLKQDSITIIYNFKQHPFLYKEKTETGLYCSFSNSDYFDIVYQLLFVTDVGRCNDKYFIKGFFNGKEYYISEKKEDFKFTLVKKENELYNYDELETAFRSLDSKDREKLYNYSKEMSQLLAYKEKTELLEYIRKFDKKSLGIIEARPFENYSFTGAKFRILNTSNKTIKYITFNFYGKNAVNDKVLNKNGTYNTSKQGIGPVKSQEYASWEFENVWFTDIVESLTLNSINIKYMDGTMKIVKMNDSLWFDESKVDNLIKLTGVN